MPFFNGANRADIPSGTLMLFQQTAAPTGWVKETTHNDKALRIVSGAVGSGGSAGFASALGAPGLSLSPSLGATTLSEAQMPSHSHSYTSPGGTQFNASAGGSYYDRASFNAATAGFGTSTGGAGSSGSHTHSFSISGSASINVAYVDCIIASKS